MRSATKLPQQQQKLQIRRKQEKTCWKEQMLTKDREKDKNKEEETTENDNKT